MLQKITSGGDKVIQCLEREGVEVIYGYSGGAAMPIFDALVDSKIKFVLVRHEQGATHMADGYARATGKPGVVLVTSGPGATNCVTGLLTALMDSVPMIVLTGQTITSMLGKDAFQEADVTGITYPVVKHSYLVKNAADIPRVMKEAFYIATSGRPGPVLIDLPKDITQGPCTAPFVETPISLPGYHIPGRADAGLLKKAAALLMKSKKPVLYVGHGAVISNAGKAIMQLAEKLGAPIVNTLLGKGACPEDHPLHQGMLGMHGTAYANRTVQHCDLIMAIGARWDDRITGKLSEFCKDAAKIHVDIDVAEFNKIVRPDVSIAADARLAIEELVPLVSKIDTTEWLKDIAGWRKQYPLKYAKKGGLRAQYVLDRLDQLGGRDCIITTDVGQHQMWAAQFCRTTKNRHWLSSGGAGTMGFGFPAAIGAAMATGKASWCIVGDGGFQMTLCELATAALQKAPVKILIINNSYLGMIRQWQELFFDNRISGADLEGNPDFIKLAAAYGVPGKRVTRAGDVDKAIKWAMAYNEGPCMIEAEVVKEDNVFPMIPAGAPLSGMITEKPKAKMEKPSGST